MARRVPSAFLLLSAALLFGVQPARSQEPTELKELQIAFRPEYDQAAMLVIYRATLPDGAVLPASVTLPIPESVGDPHAVAWMDADGRLLNARFTRTEEGDWARIRVEAESPEIQLEYYQPLTMEGDRRSFVFQWPGGVLVEALGYEVQQPPLAADFEISPPAAEQRISEQDQLTYYLADLGRAEASRTVRIEITYRRPTDDLTTELLEPSSPISPVEPARSGTPDLTDYLPWMAGGMGLILVVAGVFLYVRVNRREVRVPTRQRHGSRRGEGEAVDGLDTATTFCHNCGTRSSVSDQFCRQCGTRLRH